MPSLMHEGVVVVEIVQPYNAVAPLEERLGKPAADKPGRAGHEKSLTHCGISLEACPYDFNPAPASISIELCGTATDRSYKIASQLAIGYRSGQTSIIAGS